MQRSFDDLGMPLHQVTSCVVDVETTGACPTGDRVTEIGAVKVRGGEVFGTFSTLVNPDRAIPPSITVLTGITEAMVLPAPPTAAVLPALLEFVGDAVVVGHNIRFDVAFLDAELARSDRPALANRTVDTVALARRLVRDEVPNCRLATLADRFRLSHQPRHRALDDALATTDLLHLLLERAGTLGVLGLDDLLALPTLAGHPQAGKLRLTAHLSRCPGVYLFRDAGGRVLYVGKATDLRARVRSYFSGDDRRKVGQLLREVRAIDHVPCPDTLAAAVLEVRLIHRHLPRFNRQATRWGRYRYLKLTLDERFPRLAVVRTARAGDGCLYLGPLASHAAARRVAEAVETALPVRRCTSRPCRGSRPARCAPAQLGVALCPCAGEGDDLRYPAVVDALVRGLTVDPRLLLDPLERRMRALADAERYEEAADVRDRADALAAALRRQRRLDGLRRAERLVLALPGDGRAELRRGRLLDLPAGPGALDLGDPAADAAAPDAPIPRELADELACVAGWLDAHAGRVRVLACDGELASALPALPRFQPGRGSGPVWEKRLAGAAVPAVAPRG